MPPVHASARWPKKNSPVGKKPGADSHLPVTSWGEKGWGRGAEGVGVQRGRERGRKPHRRSQGGRKARVSCIVKCTYIQIHKQEEIKTLVK